MNLIEIKTYEVLAGTSINEIAKEAIVIAQTNNCIVRFEFNRKDIIVYPFDSEMDICNKYYKIIK